MANYDGSTPVGKIAAELPAAIDLFKAHRIDFCCRGGRPLAEALREKGIAPDDFLRKLDALKTEQAQRRLDERDFSAVPSEELVGHIIETHHEYLRRELPLLSEYTAKIMRVHGKEHPELKTLHSMFHEMKAELEHHLVFEEETVFPLIIEAEQKGSREAAAAALAAIDGAEHEHSAVGAMLAKMRKLTADYALPPEACRTYEAAFRKLKELESDLFQHIHLENNVLFPRLRKCG